MHQLYHNRAMQTFVPLMHQYQCAIKDLQQLTGRGAAARQKRHKNGENAQQILLLENCAELPQQLLERLHEERQVLSGHCVYVGRRPLPAIGSNVLVFSEMSSLRRWTRMLSISCGVNAPPRMSPTIAWRFCLLFSIIFRFMLWSCGLALLSWFVFWCCCLPCSPRLVFGISSLENWRCYFWTRKLTCNCGEP